MKEKELNIINIQIVATYIFIFSLIISLLLTYNDKLDKINKKTIFNKKQTYKISIFNRILIVVISLVFLYTNNSNRKIAKDKGININPFNLQIIASELSLLAAIIVTYVVITSGEYSIISSVENPNL